MSRSTALLDVVLLRQVGQHDRTKRIARLTPGDSRYMAVDKLLKTPFPTKFAFWEWLNGHKAVGFIHTPPTGFIYSARAFILVVWVR